MFAEVVEGFEQKQQESKYSALADGRVYKVPVKETGHKSEKNLSMALRAYAKRHHKQAKIQTGDGYVLVKMDPAF